MLLNDVPYLEPLLLWLRNDQTLKDHFTETSFFMPHHDLVSAIIENTGPDCVLPKALWVLPGDTMATSRRYGCKSPGTHSFTIAIMVKCIRDNFSLVKTDHGLSLQGQFMELSKTRALVKESVHKFAASIQVNHELRYRDLVWVRDQNLYPTSDDDKLLATALHFEININ